MVARRSVDWSVILGKRAPEPVLVTSAPKSDIASLLSACDTLLTLGDSDAVCRHAVELARNHVGFQRASIFLMNEQESHMLGTFGTGLDGMTTDERHVMFDVGEGVLDVFERAESGRHFTVLENCPIVVQRESSTEVAGRGWLACTPIRWAHKRLGILYNDPALSGAPIDEAKQARAAVLCSLVATAIAQTLGQPAPAASVRQATAKHPVLREAVEMLERDPALAGKEIAATLGISISRLVRLFKSELGTSLVEYRNRLRIDRFRELIDSGEHSLIKVARAAGFGSYAQFHRVFRAAHGTAPSDYLRAR